MARMIIIFLLITIWSFLVSSTALNVEHAVAEQVGLAGSTGGQSSSSAMPWILSLSEQHTETLPETFQLLFSGLAMIISALVMRKFSR